MELKYCLVTQNIASVIEDSLTDSDRLPDIELASGDVTFIPNVPTGSSYQIELTNGQWYSVPLGRIRAKIINGKIFHEGKPGVYLFAAGSGSNPSKISYNVSYSNLRAGGIPFSLNSFTFQAVPDEEIDLTLVKPVPGVSPAGTIRGPRGTSLESIEVDDSHLVFTTVNEAGSFEMARIPISHVVEAEAREAARQAAEGVAEITASNLAASESFKNQANTHANRAETAADKAVADASAQLVGYVEDAQTAATSADASDKSAAAHRAAAKTSETNAKSSETKAKASETKSTTEANRSETARTGSEAAQSKSENAAVKAEGMRDSAATHSASASRSESAASLSASAAKASENRAQELADAFDVEALRAEIEARIADLVDGAPDTLNTLREIAELASSNKTVQEQLTSAIAGKADKVHTHSQSQVTGLTTALGNKADKTHTHETSQVVGLDNALTGKADKAHTHAQSDISGLSTSLSNKADKTHTHSQSQITGLSTSLSNKANKSHTHEISDVNGLTEHVTEMFTEGVAEGVSLLPMSPDDPETPMWAHGHRKVTEDVPPGEVVAYANNEDGSGTSSTYSHAWVQVIPGKKYRIRVWLKASKDGSDFVLWGYGNNGTGRGITGNTAGSATNYPLWVRGVPTEWTLYEGTFYPRDGATAIEIIGITWNHSSGDVTDAVQMISGLRVWPDFAPNEHTHVSADITDAVDHIHGGRAGQLVKVGENGHIRDGNRPNDQYDLTNKNYVDSEVSKKADASHTHASSEISDATSESKGYGTGTHGKVVAWGSGGEIRRTNSIVRPPADDDCLVPKRYVDGKVEEKADKSHTHSQSDITGLSTALSGKADSTHTHTQGEVTGLTTALNSKAAKSHTHTTSQISGLGTALNGKADKTYVDNRPALFSGVGAPPSSIAGAVAGDFWLDTDTMELHKITGV